MPPDYSTQNDMEGAELVSRDFTGRERVKSWYVTAVSAGVIQPRPTSRLTQYRAVRHTTGRDVERNERRGSGLRGEFHWAGGYASTYYAV